MSLKYQKLYWTTEKTLSTEKPEIVIDSEEVVTREEVEKYLKEKETELKERLEQLKSEYIIDYTDTYNYDIEDMIQW